MGDSCMLGWEVLRIQANLYSDTVRIYNTTTSLRHSVFDYPELSCVSYLTQANSTADTVNSALNTVEICVS